MSQQSDRVIDSSSDKRYLITDQMKELLENKIKVPTPTKSNTDTTTKKMKPPPRPNLLEAPYDTDSDGDPFESSAVRPGQVIFSSRKWPSIL